MQPISKNGKLLTLVGVENRCVSIIYEVNPVGKHKFKSWASFPRLRACHSQMSLRIIFPISRRKTFTYRRTSNACGHGRCAHFKAETLSFKPRHQWLTNVKLVSVVNKLLYLDRLNKLRWWKGSRPLADNVGCRRSIWYRSNPHINFINKYYFCITVHLLKLPSQSSSHFSNTHTANSHKLSPFLNEVN